jgi:hypothetical protein
MKYQFLGFLWFVPVASRSMPLDRGSGGSYIGSGSCGRNFTKSFVSLAVKIALSHFRVDQRKWASMAYLNGKPLKLISFDLCSERECTLAWFKSGSLNKISLKSVCNLRVRHWISYVLWTGMGSNNLDSKESLCGWVWSNDATTMKSTCEVNS